MQIENFEITRGNTWKRILYFSDDDGPTDITGWKILFTAKEKITDVDASAKIAVAATITDAENGEATLSLSVTNTDLTPGSYIYDIKIITDTSDELTIVNGSITILSGVTLRDA
jgi:hypothetical protein